MPLLLLRFRRRLPLLALAGGLALGVAFAAPASGQGTESAVGWHVVRPGETLEAITAYYLGSSEAWRDNLALNPDVADPHLLFPGQRIRVLLRRGLPAGAAQVVALGREVDEQPTPIAWRDAAPEDLLRQRDGVRTPADSSARLRFGDGSTVTVGENSLLFLRGDEAQAAREEREVEIVVGQADLAAPAATAPRRRVQVVMGPVVARPEESASELAARARRPTTGGAQVMMYEGAGEVEAAGAKVELPSGTGSTVPEAGPPSPPEPLLPAPTGTSPAAGGMLPTQGGRLAWDPVPGAAGYVVEVCADPDCAVLVAREAGLSEPGWEPAIAPGAYHWRVSAVSASGLDGYASGAGSVQVVAGPLDPPGDGEIALTGNLAGFGEAIVAGPGARLDLIVADPVPGQRSELWLDGESVTPDAFAADWEPGPHRAEVKLVAYGGERALVPVEFIHDPTPPALEWQEGDLELLENHGMDQGVEPHPPAKGIKTNRDVRWLWSSDGRRWLPILPRGEESYAWVVASDRPQVFLWSWRAPEGRRLVRLWAEDPVSAVDHLTLRAERATAGGWELALVATDIVGNVAEVTIPLAGP